MTCFDLANLYALLVQGALVDTASSNQMLALLADAAVGPDPSWMTRPGVTPPGIAFQVTHTKIGLGPLKPQNGGFNVASEGAMVTHIPTGRKFIIVWQNSKTDPDSFRAISLIVDRTIKLFLGMP
jgi:hypothetical protein